MKSRPSCTSDVKPNIPRELKTFTTEGGRRQIIRLRHEPDLDNHTDTLPSFI